MLTTFIGISGLRLIIQKQKKNPNILLQVVIALEIRHTIMYMHGVSVLLKYCIIKIRACSTALCKAIVQLETCLTI